MNHQSPNPMNPTEQAPDLTFALALQALRRQSGLSQVQASELLGVPRSTWQAWEAGLRVPASYVAAGVIQQFKAVVPQSVETAKTPASTR